MIMKRKNFKKKDMKNKFLLSYHLKWLKSLKLILFLMIERFIDWQSLKIYISLEIMLICAKSINFMFYTKVS